MFFKKLSTESRPMTERSSGNGAGNLPPLKAAGGGLASTTTRPTSAASAEQGLELLLDALGGVLANLARYPFDLPNRSADEMARLLNAWQRHAMLGSPVTDGAESAGVGIQDRDWNGMVQAIGELRREEQAYVQSSIAELREALWACVETVHNAAKVEQAADSATEEQMVRAKNALTRMQTGSIKQEVLGAVHAIESAMQTRREKQQEQYFTLASKLDNLGQQLEEARRESTTDPLTGLGNRKLFDLMLPRALQMSSLGRQPVVLLLCDMDKLKLVNDMYGHQAGDQALQNLGKTLAKTFLRQSDVVCRIGGDEFAAILHNTDWKIAQTLGRRLQDQLSQMAPPHPAMEFSLGVSVGVAQLDAMEDVEEWIARADKALYKAKQNGRDRVCVAEPRGS
ncbi:MAG: hypothetical protein RLZZ621_2611 [Gemmatimonadota bacterium]|jgi:diguanylate cyclase (GGDEF)-like protein